VAVLALLSQGMRPREPRRVVMIPSRMQVGAAWTDVCIHNISSRGMLVAADEAPAPGTYVDIRRGSQVIIGRAVWRNGRFFGVRTQDKIDIDAIVREPRLAQRPKPQKPEAASADRRSKARLQADAAVARQLEQSRQAASAMQFVAFGIAGVLAAGVVATGAYEILSRPFAAVETALPGAPSPPPHQAG
jgi:hypothetical protein